jgi:hypothetical protein
MDGTEDSKAKWELLEDIDTIKKYDEYGEHPLLSSEKNHYAMIRLTKRADDLNIDEDNVLELENIDGDIENINKHVSTKDSISFGAYIFSSMFFIVTMLVLNLGLKSQGLAIDEIITNFETINGFYMILIPVLLTSAYTIALKI